VVPLDNGGRDSGETDVFAPPADLEPLVEHVWIHSGAYPHADWRVVPDASAHLIATVTARDRARRIRVALVGARSTAARVDVADRVLTVGVRLRPGVIAMLSGSSARDFVDRSIAVQEALPSHLLAGLEIGPDAPARVILRDLLHLVRRAASKRPFTPLLPEAMWHLRRVDELATGLGTPSRSLLERAYRHVGLNPKRIQRVLRLHAALGAARCGARTWSEVAHAAGYADQAHFTREAKALLGEAPTSWAARGSAVSFKTGGGRVT
jgi:AraC-like DNA-binding protein